MGQGGGGYSPKYTSTVWSLIFLDQLGANGADPRIRTACEYLLKHTLAPNGGLSCVNGDHHPASSSVLHCLNGNLVRAVTLRACRALKMVAEAASAT